MVEAEISVGLMFVNTMEEEGEDKARMVKEQVLVITSREDYLCETLDNRLMCQVKAESGRDETRKEELEKEFLNKPRTRGTRLNFRKARVV